MDIFKKGGRGRTLGSAAVFTGLSIYIAVNTFQGPLEKAATDHKPTAQAQVEEQNPEQAKTTNPSDQARNTTGISKLGPPSEEEKKRSIERMDKTRSSDRQNLSSWMPWNWNGSSGGKA